MVFMGAAVLPNGPMVLDPTMEEVPAGVDELHTAAKFVGDYIRDHDPDIVVLATPNGIGLSDSIGIYASNLAVGNAEWNKHWKDYKVSVNLHEDFSMEIFEHLQNKRIKTNLVLPFGERSAPLCWSEAVPLFFVSEQRGTTGTRRRVCPFDMVIITTPIIEPRHWEGDLGDLTMQCVRVGHELYDIFERSNYRVFFLVSASLSTNHKTLEENPLFLPEAGTIERPVSRKAILFDETVENWVRFGDRDTLLVRGIALALETFPNGMAVLGLLQGLLDRSRLGGEMLARKVPSYFGMMVALFRTAEKSYRVVPRPLK